MRRKRVARLTVFLWNVIAPIAAVLWWLNGHGWWALAIIASAHAFWLIPTFLPNCDWYGEVVTKLPQSASSPDGRVIWLTIDDGPDPQDTPALLDLLDKHQAKATFFQIGAKAAAYPHLVSEVLRRGHTIGNHTMNHPQLTFWAYGPRAILREIVRCDEAVEKASGFNYHPQWFRAPVGFKNPLVHHLLEKMNLRQPGWSARGLDGVLRDPEKIHTNLCAGIKPGAILLMHEGREDAHGGRLAPQVLSRLLAELSHQGYRCVLPDQSKTEL